METVVEFTIDEAACCIVSESEVVADTPDRSGINSEEPDGLQVVGSCAVLGRRYLILCSAPSSDPKSGDLTSIVELLTPRELQVAEDVARGYQNKQIAKHLRISDYTVASYLRRVFVKLGVRTRAAMVARMMTEGSPALWVGKQSEVSGMRESGSPRPPGRSPV